MTPDEIKEVISNLDLLVQKKEDDIEHELHALSKLNQKRKRNARAAKKIIPYVDQITATHINDEIVASKEEAKKLKDFSSAFSESTLNNH